MMKRNSLLFLFTIVLLLPGFRSGAQPVARDVVTVGTVTTSGNVIEVPVYIRDVSGTPLGMDRPAGSRIQSFSIKVDYSPALPVQSVTFTRAGIASAVTPTFEASPSTPGSVTLLATFEESSNPLPFTLNAPAPGNLIGRLTFTLNGSAAPGTVINLTLDPTLTQLTDEGGSPATRETVAAGTLQLINGSITIASAVPTADEWALMLLTAALAVLALRYRI